MEQRQSLPNFFLLFLIIHYKYLFSSYLKNMNKKLNELDQKKKNWFSFFYKALFIHPFCKKYLLQIFIENKIKK